MRIACLVLIVLAAGCSEPGSSSSSSSPSPFPMWDMHVGMSFAALDSMSFHDQQARYTCARSVLGFRTCSVPLRGAPGRMDALVDSTDTVVELTFWTGSAHMVSNVTRDDGRSYYLLQELYNQSVGLTEGWREVTPSDTVYSDEVGWTETWTAGGRWIAQVVWQGTGQPSMIRTADADEIHVHALAVARAESEPDGGAPPAMASETERAAVGELKRLVQAQRAFRERSGRHADALAPLHFIPREGVFVEIGGARPAGWWARGWTEEGAECVVWDGVPPPGPDDFEGQAGEPVCT